MSAALLKRADQQELLAQLVFFQRAGEATRKVGDSYIYRATKLSDLYDISKAERLVFGAGKEEMKQWHKLENIAKRNQAWLKSQEGKGE